jgi:hypothetical protein
MTKNVISIIILFTISILSTSCELTYNRSEEILDEAAKSTSFGNNEKVEVRDTQCEDNLQARLAPEFKASLFALNIEYTRDRSSSYNINTYLDPNKRTRVKDFLVDEIAVEPRRSREGVIHLENESVQDPRENFSNEIDDELSEYYAIEYRGYINAPNDSYTGRYQIGALSDDGVIVRLDGSSFLNDPQARAPHFHCEQKSIVVNENQAIPFSMDYFQGPRTYVANVLMWRRMSDENDFASCNRSRVNNSDGLRNDGWEVIPQDVITHDSGICQ